MEVMNEVLSVVQAGVMAALCQEDIVGVLVLRFSLDQLESSFHVLQGWLQERVTLKDVVCKLSYSPCSENGQVNSIPTLVSNDKPICFTPNTKLTDLLKPQTNDKNDIDIGNHNIDIHTDTCLSDPCGLSVLSVPVDESFNYEEQVQDNGMYLAEVASVQIPDCSDTLILDNLQHNPHQLNIENAALKIWKLVTEYWEELPSFSGGVNKGKRIGKLIHKELKLAAQHLEQAHTRLTWLKPFLPHNATGRNIYNIPEEASFQDDLRHLQSWHMAVNHCLYENYLNTPMYSLDNPLSTSSSSLHLALSLSSSSHSNSTSPAVASNATSPHDLSVPNSRYSNDTLSLDTTLSSVHLSSIFSSPQQYTNLCSPAQSDHLEAPPPNSVSPLSISASTCSRTINYELMSAPLSWSDSEDEGKIEIKEKFNELAYSEKDHKEKCKTREYLGKEIQEKYIGRGCSGNVNQEKFEERGWQEEFEEENTVKDDLLCWLSKAIQGRMEERVIVEVLASYYTLPEVHQARNILSALGLSLPYMKGVRGLLREMVRSLKNSTDDTNNDWNNNDDWKNIYNDTNNRNNNDISNSFKDHWPTFKSINVTNWPGVRPVPWIQVARDLELVSSQAQSLTTKVCWLLPEARTYNKMMEAARAGTLAPHLAATSLALSKLKTILNWDIRSSPAVHSSSPPPRPSLSHVTTPQPPQRPWLHLGDHDRTKPSCIFTVMCYNVLCDKYATRQMYGYCPSWALEWDYRKKGIMDEIKQYLADIITLQEVETDQFFNFFLPELKNEGYDGIFSPKSRAKHMSENERKYVDGCAIFWRTSKFTLVKERLIEFNQLAMANHDGSEDMLNRVMTKDNIGLAALLETKEAAWENSDIVPDKSQVAQPILVCTAHIHWDPEFCDVKLIQTIMLMSEIRQIISQIVDEAQHRPRTSRKIDPAAIQLLLCGDLNSLPDSGVVEFLTKGNVSMDHEDFKGFGYKTCLQKIAMTKNNNTLVNTTANIYTHSFRLSPAYDFSIMAYTNYTYDFKGIIDYIFHSADTMSALGVLGPIDPDWFRDNKVMGCPHPHIPSDHFSLLVQLEMRPSTSGHTHPNGLLHR